MAKSVLRRGCGEIGKHARFRAWWAQALEGSSPFSRTPLQISPSHFVVPVGDIGVAFLGLDRRVDVDTVESAADRHHIARAVEKDGRNFLGEVFLERYVRLRPRRQVERVAASLEVAVDEDILLHPGEVEPAGVRL